MGELRRRQTEMVANYHRKREKWKCSQNVYIYIYVCVCVCTDREIKRGGREKDGMRKRERGREGDRKLRQNVAGRQMEVF